jgi:predicted nucleic acid-binding protein
LIEEVFVDRSLQSAAVEDWLRRFGDQPFTLANAVSFAVMRKEKIRSAFTFDRHLSIAGFESLPLEVPAESHSFS